MKPALIAIGLVLLFVWLVEVWNLRAAMRRRIRDRERESRDLIHITGSKKWWREPPDDDLTDDY